MNKKYVEIKSEYLAKAMCYLGFKYYRHGDFKSRTFTFEETEQFTKALSELKQLKINL